MDSNIIKHYLDLQDAQRVLQFWNLLSNDDRKRLIDQVRHLDYNLLKRQKKLVQNPISPYLNSTIEPFLDFEYAGNENDQEEGKQLIREGQLGCLVLAGGQGSRLHFRDPKGMYPISVIKNKSLFQLVAEKVAAASRVTQRPLSLAIMTSPLNDKITQEFFIKNNFFGLRADQVSFFQQGMLPLLDGEGSLFLETIGQLATGPNGNGLCLKEFVKAGIWEKWREQGIRYIHMIPIDNPLADPFDSELLGFHCRQQVDISSKSIEKSDPHEKVGIFIREAGHPRVIEYSELETSYKIAKDSKGQLQYRCASLSLFCFSMDFIGHVSKQEDLPLHKAWKRANYVDVNGKMQIPTEPNAWKFETFIFDVLRYTNRLAALIYPREQIFSPLKNLEGDNSPGIVKKALQEKDRQILKQLTGLEPPSTAFELSADFYYPTPKLRMEWKGKSVLQNEMYIEP